MDSFEREFEGDDEEQEKQETQKDIPEPPKENQAEIDKLKVKRMKKWQYFRALHEKSTVERNFTISEKVFLE